MKNFIFVTLCLVAVIDSSSLNNNISNSENAAEYVKIPNGFGGIKYVNVNDEALNEIDPHFDIPNEVTFTVFTRQNPTVGQLIRFDDMSSVRASNFIPNAPTKLIVHGWTK